MANQSHLDILAQGIETWNLWREQHPSIEPDLSGATLFRTEFTTEFTAADLSRADLSKAILLGVDLSGADLTGANLIQANLLGSKLENANLSEANLSEAKVGGADLSDAELSRATLAAASLIEADFARANFSEANFSEANLAGADLSRANLAEVHLIEANLTEARLIKANLTHSTLVKTTLERTTLTGCRIYGISAWDLTLEEADQKDLIISPEGQPIITADHLEVAQFIYLLLDNEKLRNVIDTITTKVVLILGRFTLERKAVLDAIRNALRQRDYLPVLFDFEKPASRDLTETISTLAHMARFIIADITEAKSIPQELLAIVPNLPSVPVQPLLLASEYEYGMFEHLKRYAWVLEAYRYEDPHEVLTSLEGRITSPAEAKARELST